MTREQTALELWQAEDALWRAASALDRILKRDESLSSAGIATLALSARNLATLIETVTDARLESQPLDGSDELSRGAAW